MPEPFLTCPRCRRKKGEVGSDHEVWAHHLVVFMILDYTKGKISVSSVSGAVYLNLIEFNNDINVKTLSGALNISMPSSSNFNFDNGSISGNIKNEFSVKINSTDGRRFEGSVGQGASKLTISTTSGNIELMKGE